MYRYKIGKYLVHSYITKRGAEIITKTDLELLNRLKVYWNRL